MNLKSRPVRTLTFTALVFALISSAAVAQTLPAALNQVQKELFVEAYGSFLKDVRKSAPQLNLGKQIYAAPAYRAELTRNQWLDLFTSWTATQVTQELGSFPLPETEWKKLTTDQFTSYYLNAGFARVPFLEIIPAAKKTAADKIKSVDVVQLSADYPSDHTLDVSAYVADRFPTELQSFVKANRVPVYFDDGNCELARNYQARLGYRLAVKFMGAKDNASSQFMFVQNSAHPKSFRFVACDIIGQDDLTRIVAILGPVFIQGGARIVHHEKPKAIFTFNQTGRDLQINPDTDRVIVGFQNTVWWQLATGPDGKNWTRTMLAQEGAAVDLFENSVTKQKILSLANIYGDETLLAMKLLYEKGLRRFIYLGTAGGLDANVTIGDVMIPSQFQIPNGSWFQFDNGALKDNLKLTGSAKIFTDSKQGWIATLIEETKPKINSMAEQGVQALDVESRYFADFMNGHEVKEKLVVITVSDTPLGKITFDQETALRKIPMNSINQLLTQILAIP